MEVKHTPGPWAADENGCIHEAGDRWAYIPMASPFREEFWNGDQEAIANARLIAAAPCLLEAAKLAEDIIDDFLGHLSHDEQTAGGEDSQAAAALKALRTAIRKARGE